MSDIMEFSFDEAKVIKAQGIDRFKLNRSGEIGRVSIIAFKSFHDMVLAQKARDKKEALTEEEKRVYIDKINAKLGEQLGKDPKELVEIDRLDIKAPKFWTSYTHFRENGIGTIRCLSKYSQGKLAKPDICCEQMGDADQTVATIVLVYPVDKSGMVDMDLLKMRKYTEVQTVKMSAKKYKKFENLYLEARTNNMPVIDIKITLDGDPKYQKFVVENGYTATWAKEDADPELRHWVLDQGLRAAKYIKNELGFEMTREKLAERLAGGAASAQALSSGEASAAAPQLKTSYDSLID